MVHLLGGQSSGPVRRGKSGRSDQVRVRLAEVLEGSLELVGVVIVACMGVVQTGKGRGHNTERTREQEVINHWRWCWLKLSYHWFYATFCICSSPIAWAWYLCRYLGACKDSSSSQTVSWVWDTSGAVLLGLETPNAQQQMWKCQ